MTHSMSGNYPQPSFALVIENLNRELRQKGHLISDDSGNSMGGGVRPDVEEPNAGWLNRCRSENRQLVSEMRTHNFDVIRFATYRAACKLRFVQKRTNLYLVDIWNMIEAFRETGLSTLDNSAEVPAGVLETLLTCVFCSLNKRLPNSAQIDVNDSVRSLYGWLVCAYDVDGRGRLRVLSIKTSLSMMSAGKLSDKLKYAFSLIADGAGRLVKGRFDAFLQELLVLPASVFEGPSFEFSENVAHECFDRTNQIAVNDFIDALTAEPGPQCLMWLPIFQRLVTVENVYHPVQCEACRRDSFTGLRYKCQRCYNYNLCQDCFWRGRTSGNHQNDHDVKEYTFYKSPAKQLGEMMKKTMCVPSKTSSLRLPRPTDDLMADRSAADVKHIIPATPPARHVNSCDPGSGNAGRSPARRSASLDRPSNKPSADSSPTKQQPSVDNNCHSDDDEHRLIARYTARLAADANNAVRSPGELSYAQDSNLIQRELIAQLEAKNRDIMSEIRRLRVEQERQTQVVLNRTAGGAAQPRNPMLMAELRSLRQRRDELERRMAGLQSSRRDLMLQLEGLMRLLRGNANSPQSSPRVTPRSAGGRPVAAVPAANRGRQQRDQLASTGGSVMQAFRPAMPPASANPGGGVGGAMNAVCGMRNSLLVAADSVTDAVSSLVRELNAEVSSGSEEGEVDNDGVLRKRAGNQYQQHEMRETGSQQDKHRHGSSSSTGGRDTGRGGGAIMALSAESDSFGRLDDDGFGMKTDEEDNDLFERQDSQGLMRQRYGGGCNVEDESCLETDQESYIRTDDDEDAGNAEWEDAAKRWVNR